MTRRYGPRPSAWPAIAALLTVMLLSGGCMAHQTVGVRGSPFAPFMGYEKERVRASVQSRTARAHDGRTRINALPGFA